MESKDNNSNQDTHHRISPVDNSITWTGDWATPTEIESAMDRANGAFFEWSRTSLEERTAIARAFASFLENNRVDIAKTITLESGKPLWESDLEVTTSILKVDNAIDAIRSRRWTTGDVTNNPASVIRYRPLGPMIVLGPYNLPLHLPGAHIVPALLAGNTILFKPSSPKSVTYGVPVDSSIKMLTGLMSQFDQRVARIARQVRPLPHRPASIFLTIAATTTVVVMRRGRFGLLGKFFGLGCNARFRWECLVNRFRVNRHQEMVAT